MAPHHIQEHRDRHFLIASAYGPEPEAGGEGGRSAP